SGVDAALAEADTALRLFGKPVVEGHRRVAVTLARGPSVDEAREKARRAAAALKVELKAGARVATPTRRPPLPGPPRPGGGRWRRPSRRRLRPGAARTRRCPRP